MTGALSPLEREERRRRRRREEITRWGIRVLLVFLVFALGEALHDNPKPGNTVTFERTLSIPSGPPGSTVIP